MSCTLSGRSTKPKGHNSKGCSFHHNTDFITWSFRSSFITVAEPKFNFIFALSKILLPILLTLAISGTFSSELRLWHQSYRQNDPKAYLYPSNQGMKISETCNNEITFQEFKKCFEKSYHTTEEEVFRSIVFFQNKQLINRHNTNCSKTYTMAINSFTDLTARQFSQIYTSTYASNSQIREIVSKQLQGTTRTHKKIQLEEQDLNAISERVSELSISKDALLLSDSRTDKPMEEVISAFSIRTTTAEKVSRSDRNNKVYQQNKTKYAQFLFENQRRHPAPLRQAYTIKESHKSTQQETTFSNRNSQEIPKDQKTVIDWTNHAGRVRYQGICGACYTFATSDVVSSLYSIHRFGFFLPLSTQQVVDCSNNGLTYGCSGGFLEGSFAYMQLEGVTTAYHYPYTSERSGIENSECRFEGGSFSIKTFRNIEEGNCKALIQELNYAPVSIGIAGYRLQFYSGGVFGDCNDFIDHAVALVGYVEGIGWKIKNSWGVGWGMEGFAWISEGNSCGICNMAVAVEL